MESARPYRFRRNPVQRALFKAEAERRYVELIEACTVRHRIPCLRYRDIARTVAALGLRVIA